ncbi:hypothetical protein ABT390_36725 [Streptomyces aurantiacus]|uniref:Uncharacterized protein n=1 Tax=Streptomyces aurantiacus JA 4570 TaxID=1286094 RepID=S3ZR54_9ACTN|nr:hypothetical protein [Streptomyces aurantiacus]EPH40880.1 hypothetical protein STRAU_6095 [Streptomyces aurantiacus JA 4570]
MATTDKPLTAVEALLAFARRVVDPPAAQALIDEATRELAGRHVVRADQHLVPLRFTVRRGRDVSGTSGLGDVADGVLWPDGTASVRWRGEHPSAVFWDRGRVSVEFIHGHQGATEIEFVDQDGERPAPVGEPAADPSAAPLALRRVVEIALNKPVPCPDCERTSACRCMTKRTAGRIDAVLGALAPWLKSGKDTAA